MKVWLADADWPERDPPGPRESAAVGAGVGGRSYWRWPTAGPWGAALFGKAFGAGGAARRAALREFRLAEKLRGAGAPAARPWLVAESGAGTVLWSEDCGDQAAWNREALLADPALLRAAARAAAQLHRAGALHGDLHLGNLLRRPDGSLAWTDLRMLRLGRSAEADARYRDLGRLYADLDPIGARRLLQFARAYLAELRAPGTAPGVLSARECKEAARRIAAAGAQRLREHHANLDRRARRELRGSHPELWRRGDLRTQRSRLEAPEAGGEALKRGRVSTVTRAPLPGGETVVVKHFAVTKPLDPRDRIGRSKAVQGLLTAEGLRRRGLRAARPLAAWSRAGAGSWLVLEDLPAARPFHEAVLELHGPQRAALLREAARLFRRLHGFGVAYRDLKPSNVLVDLGAPAGERLFLIDHDRNRAARKPLPPELARRDLAAFHAGLPPEVRASERLRALRAYHPGWTRRAFWRRHVRPLLEEAAARRHRWIPRALLGAGAPATPDPVRP